MDEAISLQLSFCDGLLLFCIQSFIQTEQDPSNCKINALFVPKHASQHVSEFLFDNHWTDYRSHLLRLLGCHSN